VLDHDTVVKFGANGDVLAVWGIAGWGLRPDPESALVMPSAIAVGPGGIVHVVEGRQNAVCVRRYDADGKLLSKWLPHGPNVLPFVNVPAIAVDGIGAVCVVDRATCCVQRFDPHGQLLVRWGTKGTRASQFTDPQGIAVDHAGFIYVSDSCAGMGRLAQPASGVDGDYGRIQKFDSAGRWVGQWLVCGETEASAGQPSGLTVDSIRRRLYVADKRSRCVQVFDLDGGLLARHATGDAFPGFLPASVAADAEGSLYLVDHAAKRVQVWRVLTFVPVVD
jgi:DNA-binding beta-propeller fold protein YncE